MDFDSFHRLPVSRSLPFRVNVFLSDSLNPGERLDSDIDQLLTREYDRIVYILPSVRPECTGRGCINRHGFLSASVRTSHPHTIPSSKNIFRTEHSSNIKHSYYCFWQSSKPLQAGLNRFGRPGNYGVYTLCRKHRHNLL